jgi:YggT family protein
LFAAHRSGQAPAIRVQGVGMRAILELIILVLTLYSYVIIGAAILSWLIAFNVVNIRNDLVRSIWNMVDALTTPVLTPIRKILPNMGGIDISPVVLLLIIWLIQRWIGDLLAMYPYAF